MINRLELESQYKFEQKEAQRLKDLDRFKSRLFTNLTHEFRTPLTVILGMAKQISNTLLELKIPKDKKEALSLQSNMIERNGQSLLNLVNQLLDLSKLENNALKLNLQNENVIPFLNYIASSFQAFANQQNIALKYSSMTEFLKMDFDPVLLQQVLTNLLSNALKFTHSGGQINIKIKQVQEGKIDNLLIQIEDTGIGISGEKLPYIFDRFYQIDSSTTRTEEGTGIGLAHTKELIKLMEGYIEVESEMNVGSIFSVYLPIKNEIKNQHKPSNANIKTNQHQRPNTLVIHGIEQNGKEESSSQKPILLIIEDNPDVVTYIKTCLNAHYQIDVAYNGKIGIEKAFKNIPDIIISDVMMPEKDGFEVCKTLKQDEKTSHIPILLLTAKAGISSKLKGIKLGADAYLPKPFDKEELNIRLQSLLIQRKRILNHFTNQKGKLSNEKTSTKDPKIQKNLKIEHEFILKLEAILEKNYTDTDFGLVQCCHKLGMSRSQLFRKLKALTGLSPSIFIRSFRLKKAKSFLETSNMNVSEAAWNSGFSSLSHFSKIYTEEFGIPPSETHKTLTNNNLNS